MAHNQVTLNNLRQHQKFWDHIAFSIGEMLPFSVEVFYEFVPNKKADILDFGCGYGRTLKEIYQNGYTNLVGADISSRMIERGQKELPFLQLICADTPAKFLKQNFFDAIIFLGVFTCIAEDRQQLDLIANSLKWLKKGGIIYIGDFLLNTDERNIERYNKLQARYNGYAYGVFELQERLLFRHHSIAWLGQLLAPFTTLSYGETKYKTLNNHIGNGFVYVGGKA